MKRGFLKWNEDTENLNENDKSASYTISGMGAAIQKHQRISAESKQSNQPILKFAIAFLTPLISIFANQTAKAHQNKD